MDAVSTPMSTSPPPPGAEKDCLRDCVDEGDDEDEWSLRSLSEASTSTGMLTDVIKNGISGVGGDGFIHEVDNLHGLVIELFNDDTSSSPQSNLFDAIDFEITDADYVESAPKKKMKKNTNNDDPKRKKVTLPTVGKMHKSFAMGGFHDKKISGGKISAEDLKKICDIDRPLLPVTKDMLNTQEQLSKKRAVCMSLMSEFTKAEMGCSDPDQHKQVSIALRDVSEALTNCNKYISSCRKSIDIVESVRTRANRFMSDAGADPEKNESFLKWSNLVMRTNMILSLVDAEKKREAELTAAAAAAAEAAAAAKEQELAMAETSSIIDLINDDDDDDNNNNNVDTPLPVSVSTNSAVSPGSDASPAAANLPKAANGERKVRKRKTAALTNEERQERDDTNYIDHKEYEIQLHGGARKSHESIHDQSLVWENGKVFCMVCGHMPISQKRHMIRHVRSATHQEKLAKARSSEDVPLFQSGLQNVDPHAAGANQEPSKNKFKMEAMIHAGLNNISAESIVSIANGWVSKYSGETIGNTSDFVNLTVPALRTAICEQIRTIVAGDGCFDEYAITFDGTPSFAEAEAIVLRIVTKDWNVLEILVRCGLYAKKLNSDELKSHVIDTIKNRLGLPLKNWLSSHQDRAATNSAAIRKIYEENEDAKPAKNDCCSHTISNAGKKTLGENGESTFAELFRKMFQAMINHPGNARDYFKAMTGDTVITAGGIRFFQKYEQVQQIHESDPVKILSEMVQHCIDSKSSFESASKIMREFNPSTDAKANLGMAIVELAAIAEGLKTFVQACYTLEGDYNIILRAHEVFKRMEDQINSGFSTPGLEAAVRKGLQFIKEIESDWLRKRRDAENAVAAASDAVSAVKAKVEELEKKMASLTSNRSRSGRTSQRTDRTLDVAACNDLQEEIAEEEAKLCGAEAAAEKAKLEYADVELSFVKWKGQFPHRTFDSLLAHGKAVLKPAGDYYEKLFLNPEGDCYNIRMMTQAVLIFDPIELSKLSDTDIVTVNHYRAEKLKYFRYKQFNDTFMDKLKKEMPKLVKEAKKNHNLNEIKPSEAYKTRLQKRIKKNEIAPTASSESEQWMKDAGEYSERVWQWWKERRHDFPAHALALRLVVLVQLSSCSVERVFSKLDLIRDACGEKMLDDMCEVRLFLQCNGDLSKMAADMSAAR